MSIYIILFGILMGIIPFFIGILYTRMLRTSSEANSIIRNWVSGMVICLAIFYLLAMPATYLEKSLSGLAYVYIGIIALLCMISLIVNCRRLVAIIKDLFHTLRHMPWITILAVVVIGFQIYMYVFQMHVDDDDSFYVATAVTAVHTDTIFQFNPYSGAAYSAYPSRYVLSPFPILVAVLARLSTIHPTILAHTLLPVIFVPLAYGVFMLTGHELFKGDREKTAYFVLLAAVVQMFAATTTHTQGMVMLVRIWQGKALLASALLPLVFYLGMRLMMDKFEKADWFLLLSLMLACCLVSSMGIMLGAIMTGIMAILIAFQKRKIRPLVQMLLCCLPNLIFAGIYLVIR